MNTRREALAAAGLAKAGARGKFSTAALAWLEEQRKNGVKFSDDTKPVKVAKPETAKAVKVDQYPEYISPSDYRFPEEEYRAFYWENGKKVYLGMRECCACGYSFLNHPCDAPSKYGNVVTIEKTGKR